MFTRVARFLHFVDCLEFSEAVLCAPEHSGSRGDSADEIGINVDAPCSTQQKHTEGITR